MEHVRFLTLEEVLELHEAQLRAYGGPSGFIDESVVRSALARPQFTAQYVADADLADLAAEYLFGLATTQGFMDGNKRTAVAATSIFVRMNEFKFVISESLMYLIAMAVVRREVEKDDLAEMLREHLQPIEDADS